LTLDTYLSASIRYSYGNEWKEKSQEVCTGPHRSEQLPYLIRACEYEHAHSTMIIPEGSVAQYF